MIHSENYRIRNYEADTHGNLRLHSLANYFQDSADRNAIALGVGVPHLLEKGLTWVLHRMQINIHRWPKMPEEVIVTTNPSGEERVYIYRDYRMFDGNQNLLISASSTWLVFDLDKRKLVMPSAEIKSLFEPYRNMEHLPRASQKYPSLPDSWKYKSQITARYNEIDRNQHVNNSTYFQWLLEPLPADFLDNRQCNSLDITFRTECLHGQIVNSLCEPINDNLLLHRLENENGQEIVSAVSSWK